MTFSDFSRDTHFHNLPIFSRHFYSISRTFERERERRCRTKLASNPDVIGNDSWLAFRKTCKGRRRIKKQTPLLKHRAVILVPPDEDLGDGPDGLHQQVPVLLCDGGVLGQHVVQVPERKGRKENSR